MTEKKDCDTVLFIDDDGEAALALTRALKALGLRAKTLIETEPISARNAAVKYRPEAIVLDLSLDKRGVESGFELLDALLKDDPTARVIILTGHGTKEHGIRAIGKGAATFLEKPPEVPHLKVLIEDSIRQATIRRAYEAIQAEVTSASLGIIGTSPATTRLREEIQRAALSRQPVLLLGETGTGKSFCAQAIHRAGANASKPFVRYQPTFASSDLVNSDLFGHVKGAFTGASEARAGLLTLSGEGTFFLDEIEALPLETQVALLGAFQDRVFRPVGGQVEEQARFRLITASNGDVEGDIERGKLRRDFYHRVAHVVIRIPPLRERMEDIEELAKSHLAHLSQQEGLVATELHPEALKALEGATWPGNIRELHSTIEAAAWRAQYEKRRIIEVRDIPPAFHEPQEAKTFHEKVEAFKRKLINEALLRNEGSKERAAQELGIDRTTMWRTLERAK
jgi:DNA-binding NtrC family response regulator